jgi:hypothetical protein
MSQYRNLRRSTLNYFGKHFFPLEKQAGSPWRRRLSNAHPKQPESIVGAGKPVPHRPPASASVQK